VSTTLAVTLLWLVVAFGSVLHRVPLFVGARWPLFFTVLAVGGGSLLASLRRWRRSRGRGSLLATVAFGATLVLLLGKEARFRLVRHRVLSASESAQRRDGAFLVVGYRDLDEVRSLATRGAISGIYVSRRNARGRSPETLAREIDQLQAARRERSLPPLLVFADQEGGLIEHLSPPLSHRPPLGELVTLWSGDAQRLAQEVRDYGESQGRELRSVGVTHDLAPVVDLRTSRRPGVDVYSRIADRAIAADPRTVASVAAWYCGGLASAGVGCTLKHFPGLGKSTVDTHFTTGRLDVSAGELRAQDLVPFAVLLGSAEPPAAVMVTHARVPALDAQNPASLSAVVVGLLRGELRYRGLVISDDFSMLPIYLRPGGVGTAACDGVRAGLDLVLVSYDTDLFYEAMAGLLEGCAR
jgi:beta-N-acetylhexosaminidase